MSRMPSTRRTALFLGFLAAAALCAEGFGQAASPTVLAPLLPEGAFLAQARGRVGRNQDLGVWEFVLLDRIRGIEGRRLILLPSEVCTDLLRMREMLWHDSLFEVTGEITVGPEYNFLIPSFAAPVQVIALEPSGVAPPPATTPTTAPNSAAPDQNAPTATVAPAPEVGSRNPETIAAELEAALLAQAGTLPTSTDLSGPTPPPVDPFQPQSLPVIDAGAAPAAATTPDATMHAGTARLFDRRAIVSRDERTGTWCVVLHAAPPGVSANLELLPCRETRALGEFFVSSATSADILVSGDITQANGRSYLLPRRIRPLRAQSGITP